MRPLVSILMPVFNGGGTVLNALLSLQAQTCDDWECIVVDDGSTDNSVEIIRSLCDKRIQLHKLHTNRGRGSARQRCLEKARGSYIAFLDADDWIYPQKLLRQCELLEAEPAVDVVSTGMAIAHSGGDLAGVRIPGTDAPLIRPPLNGLRLPTLPFAPTMMRAELAHATGFDASFRTAEDMDFLMRAMVGKPFCILPTPLYVYREQGLTTLPKVTSALDQCCRIFKKQFRKHPVQSTFQIAKIRAKRAIYCAAHKFGLWDSIIAHRSQAPSPANVEDYESARRAISALASTHQLASAVSANQHA